MTKYIRTEPALIGGAITAVLNALVLLGVVHLDADQLGAINIAVGAVLAVLIRSQVTPTVSTSTPPAEPVDTEPIQD